MGPKNVWVRKKFGPENFVNVVIVLGVLVYIVALVNPRNLPSMFGKD